MPLISKGHRHHGKTTIPDVEPIWKINMNTLQEPAERPVGFLKRLRLPHPFVLLLGTVAVAAALTWIIPAGEYQRRTDAATGRAVVVAGTYAHVAATTVGLKAALLAMLLGAEVGYGRWLRFAIPGALLVALVGAIGVVLTA